MESQFLTASNNLVGFWLDGGGAVENNVFSNVQD